MSNSNQNGRHLIDANVAIIGSGPAALAAAWQLVSRGIRPTILDCGDILPDENVSLAEELRSTYRSCRPELLAAMEGDGKSRSEIPKKLVFGSDYFHGNNRKHSPTINESFIDPTFAKGGFTVGWGGAMLPVHPLDMETWPIGREDLENGFRQVLDHLKCYGVKDGLAEDFPLYMHESEKNCESTQVVDVLDRLSRIQKSQRFISGRSRLAVNSEECRRCGMCLTGCPFGVIQTFDNLFDDLIQKDLVDYRSGYVISSLHESKDVVTIKSVGVDGVQLHEMFFQRVFLAAGAIGSARIVLESLGLYDTDVRMLDSQKFAVPLFVPRGDTSSFSERITLPGIFVDGRIQGVENHWTHLQISSFSHYAEQAMKKKLNIFGMDFHRFMAPLLPKLMIGWGGLHSDYSGHFNLRLLRAHKQGRPILSIKSFQDNDTKLYVKAAMRGLSQNLRKVKIFLIGMGAMIGPPGSGFHFGGCLPMSEKKETWNQCDTQGRLGNWERINVIDSSVFPSIPATTMVLTIMANAWRITENETL